VGVLTAASTIPNRNQLNKASAGAELRLADLPKRADWIFALALPPAKRKIC
jgi:hypothetical protein